MREPHRWGFSVSRSGYFQVSVINFGNATLSLRIMNATLACMLREPFNRVNCRGRTADVAGTEADVDHLVAVPVSAGSLSNDELVAVCGDRPDRCAPAVSMIDGAAESTTASTDAGRPAARHP